MEGGWLGKGTCRVHKAVITMGPPAQKDFRSDPSPAMSSDDSEGPTANRGPSRRGRDAYFMACGHTILHDACVMFRVAVSVADRLFRQIPLPRCSRQMAIQKGVCSSRDKSRSVVFFWPLRVCATELVKYEDPTDDGA